MNKVSVVVAVSRPKCRFISPLAAKVDDIYKLPCIQGMLLYASNAPEIAISMSPVDGTGWPIPRFMEDETAGLLVCKVMPFSIPVPPGKTRLAFEATGSPYGVGVNREALLQRKSKESGKDNPKNPKVSETPNLKGIVFLAGDTPLACKDIIPVVGSCPCSIKLSSATSAGVAVIDRLKN